MRHISIFGAGHLTSSLLKGLGKITDQPISLYNRSLDKAKDLITQYPNLKIVSNHLDLTINSSYIFIIVPPSAILELDESFIKEINSKDSIIVSCANYLTIDKLNSRYPKTKIIRLLPNILWQIKQGVSIYSSNTLLTLSDIEEFIRLLSPVTSFIQANNETVFDKLGKLTSCGPGIFSYLIDLLFTSFEINTDNEKKEVLKTLAGTIDYAVTLEKEFTEIISEVSNKGGLTESGIAAMKNLLPASFDEISLTMDKRLSDKRKGLTTIVTAANIGIVNSGAG